MLHTACALALTVALQAGAAAPAPTSQAPASQAPTTQAPTNQTPAQAKPSADPWPDQRPITHLFQNLWHDLVALPSIDSAIIFGVGGAGAAAVHPFDDDVAKWAEESGSASYTAIGDVLGDGWTQIGGAFATYAVGKVAKHPQAVHVGGDLIRAQALNAVVTGALKYSVNRTRPTGADHAFPSGHTSSTFASAAVLHRHYGWKAGLPAYGLAGFVGWSRVRDRQHWLSDVAFGAAVGVASGFTVTAGHRERTWVVVPAAGRHSASVMFVKVR